MRRIREFHAVLGGEEGKLPSVELPFDVRATFGAARPKVKATVNGVELRTTVAVYGGKSYVGFRADIREAAGIAIGDRIRVRLEPDEEERVVDVPDDLRRALARDKAARQAFDALAFTHRKEYAAWVAEAKKPETRARRVAQTLEKLRSR
ncbi:MAG TPA: YdeI/OmpD-associated family protein [Haliangiales bacterium]|nr:YdeI/OmpD-associated family protein [Haliangiales bacterium]